MPTQHKHKLRAKHSGKHTCTTPTCLMISLPTTTLLYACGPSKALIMSLVTLKTHHAWPIHSRASLLVMLPPKRWYYIKGHHPLPLCTAHLHSCTKCPATDQLKTLTHNRQPLIHARTCASYAFSQQQNPCILHLSPILLVIVDTWPLVRPSHGNTFWESIRTYAPTCISIPVS